MGCPQGLALRAATAVPQHCVGPQHGAGLCVHTHGGGRAAQRRRATAAATTTTITHLSMTVSVTVSVSAQGTHEQGLAYPADSCHYHWLLRRLLLVLHAWYEYDSSLDSD